MSSKAKKVVNAIGMAIDALPLLRNLTGVDVPSDKAQAVLKGAHAALAAIVAGLDGEDITPEDIEERMDRLRSALYDNDAAADSALDAKFRSR